MKLIGPTLGITILLIVTTGAFAEMRPITGKPVIDSPEMLEWPVRQCYCYAKPQRPHIKHAPRFSW